MVQSDYRIAGAILAGGQARRLRGIDKGLLEVEPGFSIIEKLSREIIAAGLEEVALIANDPHPYSNLDMKVVGDIHPGSGPLGGIEAGLAHFAGRFDAVGFLACDLPNITAGQIVVLIKAFCQTQSGVTFAQTGDSICHPLCTVVHISLLPAISAAIAAGRRKVQDLWREIGATAVPFREEGAFVNINSPTDLASWQARLPEEPARARLRVPKELLGRLQAAIEDQGVGLALVSGEPCGVEVIEAGCDDRSDAAVLRAGGWIECETARSAADRLGISVGQMGRLLGCLDIKVRRCGLGCFR